MFKLNLRKYLYCSYLTIAIYTILLNKWLFIIEDIPVYIVTLAQFIISSIGLVICEKFNKINIKSVHFDVILFPALLFCCSVTLMNLNLSSNNLAMYQVSKIIVTPIIILLQSILYKQKYSFRIYLPLGCILLGTGITFYNEQNIDNVGTIILIIAVIATICYEMVIKIKQAELQMNNLQLIYYYAPLSTIGLIIFLPIFETPLQLVSRNWTYFQMYLIFTSGLLSFINNLITDWIIVNTTTLTYTILIQLKLVLLLCLNSLLFEEYLELSQCYGLILSIIGCVAYTYVKAKNTYKYKTII